jgi:beta-lactamase class D
MRKIVKLTESDLNRLVKRILKEEDELSTTTASSEKAMVDKHISNNLLDFLRLSVSWVGREETSNLLEKVISKLMDYENKDISSDYNLDFDWIRDVVREMEAPLEIGARKNREKNDFDLEQRGYTKNKY